ncbi:MAG TPA: hypothetical protein VNS09_26285 [Solirubrobacter sp.]|nr:hypothetical protein [Solirubrobacter sp.]
MAELANVHVALDTGGRRQPLSRPNLAGYMCPSLIPAGAAFGYTGTHRRRREVPIKVLIREDLTDPHVLAMLERRAGHAKLNPNYRPPIPHEEYQRLLVAMRAPELLQAAREWLVNSTVLDVDRVAAMSERNIRTALDCHYWPGGFPRFVHDRTGA